MNLFNKTLRFILFTLFIYFALFLTQMVIPFGNAEASCSIVSVSPNPADASGSTFDTIKVTLNTDHASSPADQLLVFLKDGNDIIFPPPTPQEEGSNWVVYIDLNNAPDKDKLASNNLVITATQASQGNCDPSSGIPIIITTGPNTGSCQVFFNPSSSIDTDTQIKFGARDVPDLGVSHGVTIRVKKNNGDDVTHGQIAIDPNTHNSTSEFETKLEVGSYYAILYDQNNNTQIDPECKSSNFSVSLATSGPAGVKPKTCHGGLGVETALGCIDTNTSGFINTFVTFAIGIAGGIAFLMMAFGAIRILTAAGNPESINSGRDIIISALTGLLFIVFSVFLLRLIGITIFDLPIPQ
jgi:hypothetical protein